MIYRECSPSSPIQVTGNDVLCNEGTKSNKHLGNIRYRALIKQHQPAFSLATTSPKEKTLISQRIVDIIKNRIPAGRFLQKNNIDGGWYEIEEAAALRKTERSLRGGNDDPIRCENAAALVNTDRGDRKRHV